MPPNKKRARKRRSSIRWSAILIPAGVVALLTIVSFSFAANMEEQDSFCASCHTQPESTYYAQEQAGGNPTDLAIFHTSKGTKCIDCHSGEGTTGRVSAIMMGAHNALAWYTKTAQQPAPLTIPISDGNCVKCHPDVLNRGGFNNHFHEFLPRWQAADPTAASCVDCHASHATNGDPTLGFLNQAQTEQVCQRCHSALGRG
jgi:predicted CXXCH cytochrome family protein